MWFSRLRPKQEAFVEALCTIRSPFGQLVTADFAERRIVIAVSRLHRVLYDWILTLFVLSFLHFVEGIMNCRGQNTQDNW